MRPLGETVNLALLGGTDMVSWRLEVACEGTRSSLIQIDQWRLQILEALTQAGLPVFHVRQ